MTLVGTEFQVVFDLPPGVYQVGRCFVLLWFALRLIDLLVVVPALGFVTLLGSLLCILG